MERIGAVIAAGFQLSENAGSKPLTNKYFALTEDAQLLSDRLFNALQPIFDEAYKAGFNSRFTALLAMEAADMISAEQGLRHGLALRKDERARRETTGV